MRSIAAVLLVLALAPALSGCGLIDYYFLPPPEETAQELYEAGVQAMHDKEYSDAAEYFNKLKDRYPFSPFTLDGEIGLGDAYFLDKEYVQAADAYKEFESLHPTNEHIPYVLYQTGLSNYNLFNSIDLRQTNVNDALEYFYRVTEQFPGTEYAKASEEYIAKSRRILAEHELFIADFFWRTKKFGPAWKRYSYVVENFPDVPDLQVYARERSQYCYFEYQKARSTEERESVTGSWKDYFKWL